MSNSQVIDYIKKARSAGIKDEDIRFNLFQNGWSEQEINENLLAVGLEKKPVISVVQQPVAQTRKPEVSPFVKKRLGFLIALIILFLAVFSAGGTGIILYYRIWDPMWNPFRPSPETVVYKMMENAKELKSYSTKIDGEITAKNNLDGRDYKLSISANGKSDMRDAKVPKADFTVAASLMSVGSKDPLALINANLLAYGSALYLKLGNLNISEPFSIDFSQIQGKWLKINTDSLKKIAEAQGIQAEEMGNISIPYQNFILPENILNVEEQLADEKINGQDAYHYLLKVDNGTLKDFINNAIKNGINSNDLDISMAKEFFGISIESIGDIYINVWIGKKDYMLYKAELDKTISYYLGAVAINLKINNSEFNSPALIQEPQDAQNVEDAILPIFESQATQSALYQIGLVADVIFYENQSYYTLCKNKLLNGYQPSFGAELISLNNDLVSYGAAKPVCFADAQNFCVSTQLPDGSWLCAGKDGAMGKTKCESVRTECQ